MNLEDRLGTKDILRAEPFCIFVARSGSFFVVKVNLRTLIRSLGLLRTKLCA